MMKHIALFVWIICASLAKPFLHAQPGGENRITFEHLTVENGLAHNRVWRIMQDHKGFLWFATAYGLSRYDGYKFTNFRQGGVGTLSYDDIWAVFEDHAGTIWVGTYGGGLNKFDAATQTFTCYQHDPENPNSLSNNIVRAIHELSDQSGVLWIATIGGGLNRFDTRTETFTHFLHDPHDPDSLPHNSVHTLYESRDGELWLGTGGGFSRLNRPRNGKATNVRASDGAVSISFTNYRLKPGELSKLYGSGVTDILESRDGTLWLGASAGGLSRFDRRSETYIHYAHDPNDPKSLSNGSVRSLFEDSAGVLWIGLRGGLCRFDRTTQTFECFTHNPDDPSSLSYDVVRDVFQDRSGVIWVATFGGGLSKIVRNQFIHFRHEPHNLNSLRSNNVLDIYEGVRGAIWVIMRESGLTRIDLSIGGKESYTHYLHDPADKNSISQNEIIKIIESRNKPGVFWLRTANRGLNRLNSNDNSVARFEHDPDDPNSLSSNSITTIHQALQNPEIFWICADLGKLNRLDATKGKFTHFDMGVNSLLARLYESPNAPGVLWMGTTANGLIRFDAQSNAVQHILPEDTVAQVPAHIELIYESPKHAGVLWVTTDRVGFYKIAYNDSKNEAGIKHFRHQPENPNSLASDKLWAFCEAGDGILWLGSEKGLSRFDPESEAFTNYTTEHGLPGNFIQSMLTDDHGHIWIATDAGLSRFDPVTGRFRNYSVSDGLQGDSFDPYAYAKGRDGKLYFGGLNGLNMFHPDSIKDNRYVPPVVITDFRIFNKPVKIAPGRADDDQTIPAHFSTLNEIVLSHRQNIFSFEFAALDYTAPEQNQYAYKLEGFNKDWVDAGSNRTASFTNLAPDRYIFRVKGSNNDGLWNEAGTSMRIIILPPWWRTWWAYLLYGMSFLSGLLLLWRYESNRQRHKHNARMRQMEARKLQELDYFKSTFFANISHELRTPLTLIFGQVESVSAELESLKLRNKLAMALRNSKRLLRLINQLLDLSKIEAGGMTLNAKPGNIVPLLKSLTASFESMVQQKDIDLRFESADDKIIVNYEQDKIEKIMYNLLSNALKFTPAGGNISVQLSVISNQFSAARKDQLVTDHWLLVTVKDSGIGIPQDRLTYIFDRFYQVNSAKTREHEGTGIGLALTKELVELHGGAISVESKEGLGTTFVVQLPVIRRSEAEIPTVRDDQLPVDGLAVLTAGIESEGNGEPDFSGQPATSDLILVIEDNADLRAYVRQTLEESCRVIEAQNGEEGLTKAQEYMPDLIISDIMMPKVDGYTLVRRLRGDRLTCHIPIILLTAKAAAEEKLEGIETGADAYMIKPFRAKELQVRVRKLIELRRTLRQQYGVQAVLTPTAITATSMDQEFLGRVRAIVEEHMENENFNVEELAQKCNMSMRQLQRKLKALIDVAPQQCIRSMRLQRAKQMLEQKAGTVTEIAYQVGYGDVTAFSRAFRVEFGESPSAVVSKSPD